MRISCPIRMMAIVFLALFFTSLSVKAQKLEEPKLLNYQYIGSIDQKLAANLLHKSTVFSHLNPSYEASLYKLSYETIDPFGKRSIASGLVAIPNTEKLLGTVVYLHGTRVRYDDIPSNCVSDRYQIYPALFSNTGAYVTVMPDYLGYGDSTLRPHPYMQADSIAETSIDMLKVAREFLRQMDLNMNDDLYLSGYSEGGFSAMAMFEALQNNHPDINITAVAPGSGAYDMDATISFILSHPEKNASLYTALYFHALQSYHQYWQDYGAVFQSPYDSLIPQLFDGQHDADDIRNQLGKTPQDILNKQLFNALTNGCEEHLNLIRQSFNRYEFTPTAPLLLVGTKGDKDVPFSNTLIAYEKLKAKYDDVTYKSVSDTLDHRQAFPQILLEQYLFFKNH